VSPTDRLRVRTSVVLLTAACALGAPRAAADPDQRPQDRFFFGLSAGASVEGERRPAAAYETSYWPGDWIGMGTVVSMNGTDTYDLGGELMLAVPLRWVQPYGGGVAGWRTTPDQVTEQVYLFAGVNGYASRNLRVFVELRDVESAHVMGGTHDGLILAGLRSSPDWFHRSRGVNKFDTIWWSALLSVAIWSGATLAR
jgi:hypothetical protein